MSDRETILFANDAFYLAFNNRDFDAMAALWSSEAQISCIHPGGGPIFDREAVMESWRSILGNESVVPIRFHAPRVRLLDDYAIVICFEEIAGNVLIATNMFQRQDGDRDHGWKMVHHQAGPTAESPPRAARSDKGPIVFN